MIKKIFLLVVTIQILSACFFINPAGMPPVDVPSDELNTEFRVFVEDELNRLRINQRIWLAINVIGENQIIFPPDFAIEMFQYTDGEWQPVKDVPTEYAGGDCILYPSAGDPLLWGSTSVFPLVTDMEEPVLLRIFVFGHAYQDGKAIDDKFGSYVDVTLKP